MKINTHYDNLKVARDASPEDIKRAFRKLTFQHHPDRNPPEQKSLQERRMRIIKEAYDVLSDPVLREKHDAWIKTQEFNSSRNKSQEQKGEYDESNTYHRNKGRQEMYYKELLEKEREINLNLRDIKDNLEHELYKANALVQFLRTENVACKQRTAELSSTIEQLKSHVGSLAKIYNEKLEKEEKRNKGLKWVIGVLLALIGIQFANSFRHSTDFDSSVLAVLEEHLKNESYMAPPEWKITDWSEGRFILSKNNQGKPEFITVLDKGVVTRKLVFDGLQGRSVGTEDCDKSDPYSPVNKGESIRYRFIQLETNTMLNINVPYTHLCKE